MCCVEETIVTYGRVAWFDPRRGVGAITVEGTGHEVAAHSAEIDGGGRQSLRTNDRVAFTLLDGSAGPRAARIWVP
jgi:cold shock CspA family protein